jgi:hypothetical protein
MYGRKYRAVFSAVSVSAAQDLFELVAASGKTVAIHGWGFGQTSDVGDAAEEILAVSLDRGATSSGSGGSSVTPTPKGITDAAFGGTVERNNTTQASSGTIVNVDVELMNVRIGCTRIYTPESRPILTGGERSVRKIPAPSDALTMSGWLEFEEIG